MVGYVAFRLSFTFRSIRARRDGDTDRADRVSQQGFAVFRAGAFGLVIAFFVAVAFIVH